MKASGVTGGIVEALAWLVALANEPALPITPELGKSQAVKLCAAE